VTHAEAGRLGGQATAKKYGSGYMAKIGSRGFWAMLGAVAERQQIPVDKCYSLKNILPHLKAKKGGNSG